MVVFPTTPKERTSSLKDMQNVFCAMSQLHDGFFFEQTIANDLKLFVNELQRDLLRNRKTTVIIHQNLMMLYEVVVLLRAQLLKLPVQNLNKSNDDLKWRINSILNLFEV